MNSGVQGLSRVDAHRYLSPTCRIRSSPQSSCEIEGFKLLAFGFHVLDSGFLLSGSGCMNLVFSASFPFIFKVWKFLVLWGSEHGSLTRRMVYRHNRAQTAHVTCLRIRPVSSSRKYLEGHWMNQPWGTRLYRCM